MSYACDWLEVTVVHETESQSDAIALRHMILARCGLNVLVLSRDHLPDCSVYYGSKSYSSSHFFCKKMASHFVAPVSDSKELQLCSSAFPTRTNVCSEWVVKLWADWTRAPAVEVDPGSRK